MSQKSVKARKIRRIVILEEPTATKDLPILEIIGFPTATLPCESASVNINWRPIMPLGHPREIKGQKFVKPKKLFAGHKNAIANSLQAEWEELK